MSADSHYWSATKTVALSLLLLLQAGDYLSTRLSMNHGAVEGNPLLSPSGGASSNLLLAKLAVCMLGYLLLRRCHGMWHVWALCGFYAAVVIWNIGLSVVNW
jgi:Domain of unknown function (DUF5658)